MRYIEFKSKRGSKGMLQPQTLVCENSIEEDAQNVDNILQQTLHDQNWSSDLRASLDLCFLTI